MKSDKACPIYLGEAMPFRHHLAGGPRSGYLSAIGKLLPRECPSVQPKTFLEWRPQWGGVIPEEAIGIGIDSWLYRPTPSRRDLESGNFDSIQVLVDFYSTSSIEPLYLITLLNCIK